MILNKLINGTCRLLEWAMAAALLVMVILVFGNVVLRYGFNSGITVSEEVSRWLFVWLTFIGAAVALKEHGHLGTDMLVSRLGQTGKRICLLISQLFMLYITWLLLRGAWAQAQINLDVEAPVTGLSTAVFYASGVVFALLTAVILLRDTLRTMLGRLTDKDLVMVQDSEDLAAVEALHIGDTPPITSQSFGPTRR